ncbi:MAG: transcription elongation factor GreA [Candidatus Cloacimonetes bacterium]|nr:transcription elongation factor GreA [Candidatus Cloacimonadota bacterium]
MDLSIFITLEGMEKIQRRIAHLMNDERPEIIKAVATAREFGDLSENAEYKAARERQRAVDGEIDHLRRRAAILKVVDTSSFPKDKVRFGSTCHTEDISTGEKVTFRVVGADELNFFTEESYQAVSAVSPIGSALLGKGQSEVALVKAPMGERQLKVLQIL